MQSTRRALLQNLLHDIQAAVETKGALAASPLAQRQLFLHALRDDILRRRHVIYRANMRDCDAYSERIPHRGVFMGASTATTAAVEATSPSSSSTPPSSSSGFTTTTSTAHGASSSPPRVGHEQASRMWRPSANGASSATSPLLAKAKTPASSSPPALAASFSGAASTTPLSAHTNNVATPPSSRSGLRTHLYPSFSSQHDNRGGREHIASSAFTSGGTGLRHRQFSQIKLEKLCATIDYLLTQPDPIAIPRTCWLNKLPGLAKDTDDDRGECTVEKDENVIRNRGSNSDDTGAVPVTDAPAISTFHGHGLAITQAHDPEIDVSEIPVPIGLVGVLSRYRPRMCIDAVATGLLAGNAMLLDTGSTLYCTNMEVMESVHHALSIAALPQSSVVYVETYGGRSEVTAEWLQLADRVDLGLVCGPPKLYQFATEVATIPLLRATGHAASLYVDQSALFDMALELILNSKFQKHAAANSVTTLIIHQDFPRYTELLSALARQGVVLLGDRVARDRAPDAIAELVSEDEYKGLSQGLRDLVSTLCVKSVGSIEQALLFLDLFGAKQADGIIASDPRAIDNFCRHVDSCAVLVNTSTRLSSGVSLGCGPDLAVATSKIHCRGPITVSTLTTTKVLVRNRTPGVPALRR